MTFKNCNMKNLLLVIAVIALFTTSCENAQKPKQETAKQEVVVEQVTDINIDDFDSLVGTLVNKEIKFSGVVDHVCQHGGQRMFIVSPNSDVRIKVTTGENMAAFPGDMEGSNLVVSGVIDEVRIDENYLKEWEEEIKAEVANNEEAEHEHEEGIEHNGEGEDHHDHSSATEQIANFRQQLKDTGKDHLSFYSITCTDYKVIDSE